MLTYYRDAFYNPVPTGDAYATLAQIEPLVSFHAKWKYINDAMKEDAIKAASAQLDIMNFQGAKVDPTQNLQFPREYNETAGPFSREGQDRKLLQALAAQVEYNLNRAGIGVTAYSHGNESLSPPCKYCIRPEIFAIKNEPDKNQAYILMRPLGESNPCCGNENPES